MIKMGKKQIMDKMDYWYKSFIFTSLYPELWNLKNLQYNQLQIIKQWYYQAPEQFLYIGGNQIIHL